MVYEWDESKSGSNLAKHGLDFADAEQVLTGPCVSFIYKRFEYGEERFISLGLLASRVVIIAHAPRGDDTTRIISMRKAIDVSKKSIKSDLAKVDRVKDADIDYSDIPALDTSFFTKATAAWPPAKQQLTIRLDADVLKWLKANGRGYQTRINRILRAAMDSQPPRRSRAMPVRKKSAKSRGALKPT